MLDKKFNVHNHGEAIYQSWDTIIILFYRQRDGYAEGDYTLFHTLNACIKEYRISPTIILTHDNWNLVKSGIRRPKILIIVKTHTWDVAPSSSYSLIHVLVKKNHIDI
jgi:hypothetical protein